MFNEFLSLQNGTTFVQYVGNIIQNPESSLLYWIVCFLGLVMSITIHHYAQAWMSDRLCDDTPKLNDRLTLNPFYHFDFFGFILVLFSKLGYGKPVPINPNSFDNPVKGTMLVALAGPVANLLQFLIYTILFIVFKNLIPANPSLFKDIFVTITYALPAIAFINFALMLFNMLPIYPLAGSRIWGYMHYSINEFILSLSNYSVYIIIFLIFPIFGESIFLQILEPLRELYLDMIGYVVR